LQTRRDTIHARCGTMRDGLVPPRALGARDGRAPLCGQAAARHSLPTPRSCPEALRTTPATECAACISLCARSMASQPYPLTNMPVAAAVDPAFWTQAQESADLSPLALHLSPSASSTTHESQQSTTPPAPRSDGERKNSQSDQHADQNGNQARTSVAVACVPCRSRHLKCDGGVRCSRCRADGVDCTYIKSRRGWKGKRKKPGENGAPAVPGLCLAPSTTSCPLIANRPRSERPAIGSRAQHQPDSQQPSGLVT
jgi:hypothetical protein